MKPFSELLVIEMAGSIAGAYTGKLFSDYGARVLKVEPPDGDSSRRAGTLLGDGTSALFHSLNTGKESLCADLSSTEDAAFLRDLLSSADVLIESSSPEPLQPLSDDIAGNAELVRLRISPFGLSGPYASWHSTAFTDFAISGHMYLTGEPDREPLQGAGPQALYASGTYGFIGAMSALYARDRIGQGQDVDVSHFEVMTSLHQWTTVRFTHGGVIQRRAGNKYGSLHPSTIYECSDGYVAFGAVGNEPLSRFLAVIGMADLLADPRFESGARRFDNAEAFDAVLGVWMLEHTVAEVVRLGQEVRAPVAPVQSITGILEDVHLNERGFWRSPPGEALRYPGPPFRMSRHPWELRPSPELCSTSKAELTASTFPSAASADLDSIGRRPLEGLRIVDLTRVWAGPLCTRILGDLGADVIKVEAPWARGPGVVSARDVELSGRYPNNQAGERPWNREGMFNKLNRSKRSITLDLHQPEGIQTLEELIKISDVVIENYTPRVMPQLGLSYERLKELNPSVISIGMPGYGRSGPSKDFAALGTTLEPEAGLSSLMGYEDSGPYKSGVAWADPVAALHAAAAILIALNDREAESEKTGQDIELAQLEGMICFVGEEVLAAQVRGGDPPRRGNRSDSYWPQGAYPCEGDDRWIAISVTGEAEWRSLCAVADMNELAALSVTDRRERCRELDQRLANWTRTRNRDSLARELQEASVAAAPVADARDLLTDLHLEARKFWAEVDHVDAGRHRFPGLPIQLSRTPARYELPAPCLGEHNREVLSGLLGLSEDTINDLRASKVIVDQPPA